MYNVEEMVSFFKMRCEQLGMTQKEVLEKAGCSESIIKMSLARNVFIKLETIIKLSEVLKVTVEDMLGFNDVPLSQLPDDIKEMLFMLKELPPRDRRLISMNIKNYVDVRREELSCKK